MIIVPILIASLMHFFLEGSENVLLGSERVDPFTPKFKRYILLTF